MEIDSSEKIKLLKKELKQTEEKNSSNKILIDHALKNDIHFKTE